jgi:hypothetical protein
MSLFGKLTGAREGAPGVPRLRWTSCDLITEWGTAFERGL